ncbi:hypothetical protein Y032_0003g1649 [Ancylostoma ceylanicum]|uniref:Uncharacterized protein n=1 Tax=Ancylostoma ceylanicum TaxID=53326 RepID=A0A016VZZ3_9BILA|nr:hypothetical protein Y032_0003g1649 [Ancylostoma ceylanicum]
MWVDHIPPTFTSPVSILNALGFLDRELRRKKSDTTDKSKILPHIKQNYIFRFEKPIYCDTVYSLYYD